MKTAEQIKPIWEHRLPLAYLHCAWRKYG